VNPGTEHYMGSFMVVDVMLPLQQLCSVVAFYDYWENIMIKLRVCVADHSSFFTQLDGDLCGPSSITHTLFFFFLVRLSMEGSSVFGQINKFK